MLRLAKNVRVRKIEKGKKDEEKEGNRRKAKKRKKAYLILIVFPTIFSHSKDLTRQYSLIRSHGFSVDDVFVPFPCKRALDDNMVVNCDDQAWPLSPVDTPVVAKNELYCTGIVGA